MLIEELARLSWGRRADNGLSVNRETRLMLPIETWLMLRIVHESGDDEKSDDELS